MAINLAEDAIHALNRAAAVAAREGADATTPRHILAGVLSQRDPALVAALAELSLDLDALPEPMRNAPETYGGHLPFTPPAHEVLSAAIEASTAAGRDATASGHLLVGIATAGDEEARGVVEEWGMDGAALAAALAAQTDDHPGDPEAGGDDQDPDPATPEDPGAHPPAPTIVTAALVALCLACAPDAGDPPATPPDAGASATTPATPSATPATPPGDDPFAAAPADGPPPEIGPAPDDYTPTAAGAPSTDIWVGQLDRGPDGALVVRGLVNATDRDGYDNQPSFDPAGAAIHFTAAVDATQTETFRYRLDTGAVEPVTRTPAASEFSPTTIPGQDALSTIREVRGRQHLWRYGADGADLGPIFATVEPVGYHAWADDRTVAMFVLGDPPTLQVGDALSGVVRTVAENPGRSLHRIPGTDQISFVRKVADDEWWIERLDPATGDTERIAETLPGREDHAWTPTGEILMGDGTSLHAWAAGSWTRVAALDGDGAGEISRLAVSPDGARIAMVRAR